MALMTEEELKQWILRRLGAPFWKIELTCDHLDDAIHDAVVWFIAKRGVIRMMDVQVAPGQTVIDLEPDVGLVTDVASSQTTSTLMPIQDELGFNQIVVGAGYSYNSARYALSEVVQRLQYLETAKRVFSADFEWTQHGQQLFIGPQRTVGGKLVIWYKSHSVTLEQLSEKDFDYVKKYALAIAKEILGRVRSKYPDFPSASGSTSLDGATLLEESRAEIEALNEAIKDFGLPMMFAVG